MNALGPEDLETLARALHSEYLAACVARGDNSATNTSLVDWADLPDDLRRSNLAAAEDIPRKLALVGREIAADRPAAAPASDLDQDEIERLARAEHERWVSAKRAEGWRRGPQRDRIAKEHPDLVGWDALRERERQLDRHTVRRLPALLHQAGYLVVRVS